MGTRLTCAPVFFTLAQMRFNPVLAMEPLLPDLQEDFRKAGFPDYQRTQLQSFEVSPGPEVRETTAMRLVYRNKSKTARIVLDPGAMTYELTDYPDSREFSEAFIKALEVVHRHRTIEYYDRLGMRMLDAVQPREGRTFNDYLVPQALGFTDLMSDSMEFQQSLTEILLTHGHRSLVVRTARVPQGIAVPPDLAPLQLQLDQRFTDHVGETITLDCDSSSSNRVDFSPETIKAELAELKAALSNSFKALVNTTALAACRTWH